MEKVGLMPHHEAGEWKCLACGTTIQDSVAVDDDEESALVFAALIRNQKLCPDCNQPMFFEPYLKGGPPRDTFKR
jgi:ribosomal protein S27AE